MTLEKAFAGSAAMLDPPYTLFHEFKSKTLVKRDLLQSDGLTLCCWNLLAPAYDRRDGDQAWEVRVGEQIKLLETIENVDFIMLQEFWCVDKNVKIWEQFCETKGYNMFVSKRTSRKVDGCAILIRNCSDMSNNNLNLFGYRDFGDRICQVASFDYAQDDTVSKIHLLNTHFTFPHPNNHDPLMRIHQGRKLREIILDIASSPSFGKNDLIIAGGDLNGARNNPAIVGLFDGLQEWCLAHKFNLNISSDHLPKDFVSHLDHHKRLIGCDFVFTLSQNSGSKISNVLLLGDINNNLKTWKLSDHSLLKCKVMSRI